MFDQIAFNFEIKISSQSPTNSAAPRNRPSLTRLINRKAAAEQIIDGGAQ